MTETQTIIEAYRRARAENVRAALATVVRVDGSAYRRPGARMVVSETGRTAGVISGGCLDGNVRERAARVMHTGRPILVEYDTTTDDDLVWGLGLGCNGIVQVLIEPAGDSTDELMRFLETCSTSHRRAACATVIRSESPDLPLGTRMCLYPDGSPDLDEAGAPAGGVGQRIAADLWSAVHTGISSFTRYGTDAEVEAFIEVVDPRFCLVIFGAGADVIPLVIIANHLGWHTTVVDTLARTKSVQRFAEAHAVVLCRPEEVDARVTLTESTAAVVMTHNYGHDLEVLRVLLNGPARYIGCLGPRPRTERLLSNLSAESAALQQFRVGRLHAPIGLDVGAETSSEIALSIAAEVLSARRDRSGGPLRQRQGSIHGRTEPDADQGSAAAGAFASIAHGLCGVASA
jgi:xanthine/CO dehydrogenase XdhC/CoxF family maturation factor